MNKEKKTRIAIFIVDTEIWAFGVGLVLNNLYGHKYEQRLSITFLCFGVDIILCRTKNRIEGCKCFCKK